MVVCLMLCEEWGHSCLKEDLTFIECNFNKVNPVNLILQLVIFVLNGG